MAHTTGGSSSFLLFPSKHYFHLIYLSPPYFSPASPKPPAVRLLDPLKTCKCVGWALSGSNASLSQSQSLSEMPTVKKKATTKKKAVKKKEDDLPAGETSDR